jgi:flagellar basal-body rod protein FlgF
METASYTTLTRQSGLLREMQVVANNIANLSTTGFRREGVIFSEYVARLEDEPSLSMAWGNVRELDLSQGGLVQTGGAFDLGIEGDGFFLVDTPAGQGLTRAGSFTPSDEGILVTNEGFALLDTGGAPIRLPDGARQISIGLDGTLSADGAAVAQIGLWQPTDPLSLKHAAGTVFYAQGAEPAETGQIRQGFLEESNVNPVQEIARMIEVQRAYELGQSFLDAENERAKSAIQVLGR